MRVDEAKLRTLWKNRDLTAAQIGAQLGLSGPNIGPRVRVLAAKLGLPKRAPGHSGPRKVRATRSRSSPEPVETKEPYKPPLFTDPNAVPTKGPSGAASLESATKCQWPIGDPQHADFRFCGGKRVPGKPYCEAHSQAAYQPGTAPRIRVRQREL